MSASKAKEAEQIRLKPYPTVSGVRNWTMAARDAVAAACGQGEETWKRTNVVERAGQAFEGLAASDMGFVSLDNKRSAATSAVAQGDGSQHIYNRIEQMVKDDLMIKGRQNTF